VSRRAAAKKGIANAILFCFSNRMLDTTIALMTAK
jgi:hypothetical protein